MSALWTALHERSHDGLVEDYIKLMERYKFLDPEFLKAMEDIAIYGNEKHNNTFLDTSVRTERLSKDEICDHAGNHYFAYLSGTPHDTLGTLGHQLAAVAYNAMMEFHLANKEARDEYKRN